MRPYTPEEVHASFGQEPLVSEWIEASQAAMDQFAAVTRDRDWMHVDPERAAREGPFDGTIAFGFWTLSMLTHFLRSATGQEYPPGVQYGFNYGLDRVRFLAPIPVGSRIRNHISIDRVIPKGRGRFVVATHNEIEVEGRAGPALVADWLVLFVYPSSDDIPGAAPSHPGP